MAVTGPDDTLKAEFKYVQDTLAINTDTSLGTIRVIISSDPAVQPLNKPYLLDRGQPYWIIAKSKKIEYQFNQWSINNGSPIITNNRQDSTQIRIYSNVDITAFFKRKQYNLTLTVAVQNTGTVTGPDSIYYGIDTTIIAQPSFGYHFKRWTITSDTTGGAVRLADTINDTTKIRAIKDVSVVAQFEINKYKLFIRSNDTAGGSTDIKDSITINHDTNLEITATPKTGYLFQGWRTDSGSIDFYINDSIQPHTTIRLLHGNAKLSAIFVLKQYNLTVLSADQNMGTVISRTSIASHGIPDSIFAIPVDPYRFKSWHVDSGTVTIGNSLNDSIRAATAVVLTQGDALITATFELKKYHIQKVSTGGQITAPDSIQHGDKW
jgi:hypothetical protein